MKKIFFSIAILALLSCQQKKADENDTTQSSLQQVDAQASADEPLEEEDFHDEDEDLELPENYNQCPESSEELVPAGFCLLEKIEGDLNKDGLQDYVLLVKDTKREAWEENQFGEVVDRNRRGIIIALNKGGHYQQYVANYSCFESENEDGGAYFAPEMSVFINDKGNLIIHYSHGRYGYWFYTFRFQNDTFNLIGYESHSNSGPIPKTIESINFSTKKKKTSSNVSEDEEIEKWEHTWEDIDYEKQISLENIINFGDLFF